MAELDGRVTVVTGGTRGIGRAIAEAFLREGAQVVINGRSAEKGRQALAEMGGGDGLQFVAGDVKRREDCERAVDTAVDRYGRIDILVNNAGGFGTNVPVTEVTDEAFQDALLHNLWSSFWGTRRALQLMIPQRWGRIINISSVEGKCGRPGLASYVAAKHAVNGLTKAAAQEVGTLGITVNAICPGAIETDNMREQGALTATSMGLEYEQLVDRFAQETATKRLVDLEDVAALALLLASEAGGGITGSMISVDGGVSPY